MAAVSVLKIAPDLPCSRRRMPRGIVFQQGFSLIEVSIVTAIVLLIAVAGIPAIGSYVIENKVPKVGEELQHFIVRAKANAQGAGPAPYLDASTGSLANASRHSSVLSVRGFGADAVVAHGLGGTGLGDNGTIAVAPADLADGGPGSGFSISMTNVNNAACPSLASVMQQMAEIITVEGRGGAVTVKDSTLSPPLAYSALLTEAQCESGDSNSFTFVAR